jgi:hypothetical protein
MPAASSTPPTVSAQASNIPGRGQEGEGRPQASQWRASTRQAHTRRARFSLAHRSRWGWRKPVRVQGLSLGGSSRTRTQRRASSRDKVGLLPVTTHKAMLGRLTMLLRLSRRSLQTVAVMAAERVVEARALALSMSTTPAPCSRMVVMAFRHSSSVSRGLK